jgi:hypothetical protein
MTARLSALRAGRPLPPRRFLILISVKGRVNARPLCDWNGWQGEMQSPQRLSNPRPSGTAPQAITLLRAPERYVSGQKILRGCQTERRVGVGVPVGSLLIAQTGSGCTQAPMRWRTE